MRVPRVAVLPLQLAPFLRNTTRTRGEVRKKQFLYFPASSRLKISLFSTIQLYKDLFCVRANELTSVVVKYRPLTRRRRHRRRKRRRKKKIIKGDDEEGRSRSKSDGVAFGFSVHLFDNLNKLSLLFSLSRNDDVAKGARTSE